MSAVGERDPRACRFIDALGQNLVYPTHGAGSVLERVAVLCDGVRDHIDLLSKSIHGSLQCETVAAYAFCVVAEV